MNPLATRAGQKRSRQAGQAHLNTSQSKRIEQKVAKHAKVKCGVYFVATGTWHHNKRHDLFEDQKTFSAIRDRLQTAGIQTKKTEALRFFSDEPGDSHVILRRVRRVMNMPFQTSYPGPGRTPGSGIGIMHYGCPALLIVSSASRRVARTASKGGGGDRNIGSMAV